MTWISIICLLALTSSAFSLPAYGGSDVLSQTSVLPSGWAQKMIPKTILPINTMLSQSYGQTVLPSAPLKPVLMHTPAVVSVAYQQQQQPIQQSFVAPMTLPKTLSVHSYAPASQLAYGAVPTVPQLDQQVTLPVLTEADILCKGHRSEDVIPIDNHRKFIICLDNGKGVEQQCPEGLFYHPTSQRCERNLGPLEDACSSQPCLNGGQCLSSGSSFQCQCAPGFEGVVCELDARICQTQQPCGSSPDAKCQSYRVGAALPYICIFQGGLAYGLNAQQVIPSPCQGVEGTQALAVSQGGFIMCDTQRLFVESCPGGTIWDDVEKACSWPDQQAVPQEAKTLTSGYGYGSQMTSQQQQTQMVIPKQLGLLAQSYGTQIPLSQPLAMTAHKQFLQPTQSYGAQVTLPQQLPKMIAPKQWIQPTQSYGAQLTLPQQQQTIVAPKQWIQPTQSYGAQAILPQQQQTIIAPKQLIQPTQSYGAQITLPQQQQTIVAPKQWIQPTQSYGAQVILPQQQQQSIIAAKQVIRPTESFGAEVQVPQEQPKMVIHKDVSKPEVAAPYGAAQFPSY